MSTSVDFSVDILVILERASSVRGDRHRRTYGTLEVGKLESWNCNMRAFVANTGRRLSTTLSFCLFSSYSI